MKTLVAMPRTPSYTTISRGSSKKQTKHPMIPSFAPEEEGRPIEDISYVSYLQRTPSQDAKIGAYSKSPSSSTIPAQFPNLPTFPEEHLISLGPPTPPGDHTQQSQDPPEDLSQLAQSLDSLEEYPQSLDPTEHPPPTQSLQSTEESTPSPDTHQPSTPGKEQSTPITDQTTQVPSLDLPQPSEEHAATPAENPEFLFPSSKFFFSTLVQEDPTPFEDVPLATPTSSRTTDVPHPDTPTFTPQSPDTQSPAEPELTQQKSVHNITQLDLQRLDSQLPVLKLSVNHPSPQEPELQQPAPEPALQQPAPQKYSPSQNPPLSPIPPNFGSKPMIVVNGQQVQTHYAAKPQSQLPFPPVPYEPVQIAYQPPTPQTIVVTKSDPPSSFWNCFINPSACFSCMRSQGKD